MVGGGGAGGWCLNVDIVIGFGSNLDLGTLTEGQADQQRKCLIKRYKERSTAYKLKH